jgi:hypothetical protein
MILLVIVVPLASMLYLQACVASVLGVILDGSLTKGLHIVEVGDIRLHSPCQYGLLP